MTDFYRQLRDELVRDLTMRGWSAADAEDGAQAALLEILARKNNVDHPRAYAYTIANRLLSRANNRRRPEVEWPDDMVEPESTDRNVAALVEIFQDCLTALWGRPTQRRVMGLAMAGYSNREIADTLGMLPATVRTNLGHARKAVRPLYPDTLDDVRHIQLLHDSCAAYRSGESTPVPLRPVIRQYWDRAKAMGMPTSNGTEVEQIGEDELAYRRARSRLTTDCAWVLGKLNKLAADTGSMSVLADADGVVLARGGDRGIMGEADKIGFVTQAWWNFDHVGPGGIALAIETRRMVVVRLFEHFMVEQENLSCAAVPIVHPRDGRMWILNLTGTRPGFHHAILCELEKVAWQLARQLRSG